MLNTNARVFMHAPVVSFPANFSAAIALSLAGRPGLLVNLMLAPHVSHVSVSIAVLAHPLRAQFRGETGAGLQNQVRALQLKCFARMPSSEEITSMILSKLSMRRCAWHSIGEKRASEAWKVHVCGLLCHLYVLRRRKRSSLSHGRHGKLFELAFAAAKRDCKTGTW